MGKKLPVGIQSFEKVRTDGFVYVDQTEYKYQLVHENVPYFLSRPRRFGKSLLLSALKAYWEGKRELFSGLVIEQLEKNNPDAFKPYPVFYFDFDGEYYENTAIEKVLNQHLSKWEEIYGDKYKDETLGYRFERLLEMAAEMTGRRCVVLVDEYDKPLLDTIEDHNLQTHIKTVFKGFFSRLKKADDYIQFIFITGVTKFHKVSIFSDLNQLRDISITEDYAALCGITEKEMHRYFENEIAALAERRKMTTEECYESLKKHYDGYHFHPDSEGVYNPYSLLGALMDKDFGSYWFETGTPTFLTKKLKDTVFDVRKLTDGTLYASEGTLKDFTGESLEPVPLLYQTGYLTICDYDAKLKLYTLGFPNEEVKNGFLKSLLTAYVPEAVSNTGKDVIALYRCIEKGDTEGVRSILMALFAGIPYTSAKNPFEHYFASVIYVVFVLLGIYVKCEVHSDKGRADCIVETKDYVYIFEFKLDRSARTALAQIEEKQYALPYAADLRKLFKIGVNFASEARNITEWKVKE